jgi:hypothetical protein
MNPLLLLFLHLTYSYTYTCTRTCTCTYPKRGGKEPEKPAFLGLFERPPIFILAKSWPLDSRLGPAAASICPSAVTGPGVACFSVRRARPDSKTYPWSNSR